MCIDWGRCSPTRLAYILSPFFTLPEWRRPLCAPISLSSSLSLSLSLSLSCALDTLSSTPEFSFNIPSYPLLPKPISGISLSLSLSLSRFLPAASSSLPVVIRRGWGRRGCGKQRGEEQRESRKRERRKEYRVRPAEAKNGDDNMDMK